MTQATYLIRPWGRMCYYYQRSHEPALVLIHGAWCDADDWNAMTPFLPPDQGVLTFDLRGHGRSDGPGASVGFDDHVTDIVALIDQLALTRPVLMGHSLGGMLAMGLAGLYPGRVSGLALLEGWTSLGVPWEGRSEMYGMLPDSIKARIKRKWDDAQRRWPQAVLTQYWETVRQANAARFLVTTRLAVLQLYGDRGKSRPTREMLGIPDRPNVELAIIPGAGHYLALEQPRAVAEEITAWLRRRRLAAE